METPIPDTLMQALTRQKYHFVGNHSAVKACAWLQKSLVHNKPCYKQKFYGIRSHECIQMTPTVFHCTQKCLFCWRAQTTDLKSRWNETILPKWDPPETIVQQTIDTQIKILSGYKGNPKVDQRKLREAHTPKQAAISLAGEPTLYQPLGELLHAYKQKGFTTFLVTNGTQPETLARLSHEPTQLYISVCAPDERTFRKICRPQIPNAWKRLRTTLELLHTFKCPTVIRMTLARNTNMNDILKYARLVQEANPTYIEPKAYMHVGFSRLRLTFENMPTHHEIRRFATALAQETSYNEIDESPESKVVLLSRLEKPIRFDEQRTT